MAFGAIFGGLFGALSKTMEIKANNEAAVTSYKATEDALTINQGINWNRASELTRETVREANMQVVGAKADITKGISKVVISRGEGVTAGISAARSVSNVLLQSSKIIGGIKQEASSKVTEMWAATEEANFSLQQQKTQAYNNMRASLVTGPSATMSILGGLIGGAQAGDSIGGLFNTGFNASTTTEFGKGSGFDFESDKFLFDD